MIRRKKSIKALALGLMITVLSCSIAFADTAAIPMSLDIKAKVIDVSVTEKVIMSAASGKSVMTVSDISIKNNAASNSVYLMSASYGGNSSPWTLVSNSTNFKSMAKNQHKYSLTADGTDLHSGDKSYSEEISSGGTYTITMAGKTGLSTTAVSDQQAGTVVVTVSLYNPAKIVSWANGTDEEIAAMVDAAERGEIDLTDYWTAGDTRTVHLDAMPASYGQTAKSEMDVQMILALSGRATYNDAQFDSFSVVIYAPQLTNMKRHNEAVVNRNNVKISEDTITDEAIYSWLNDTFASSLSKSFKSIFGNARSMIIGTVFPTYITSTFRPLSSIDVKLIGKAAQQFIASTYTSEAWLSDYYDHDYYTSNGLCVNMEEPNYVRTDVNLNEEAGMFYLVGFIRGGPKAVKFTVDGWETNKNFAKEGDTWNDVYSSIYVGVDTSLSIQDGRVYTTSVLGNGYLTLNGQPVYATDQIVNGARYVVEEDTTS